MKKIQALVAILGFVFLCSFAPAEWVKIQNAEGRFSILFPMKPEETERELETEIGKLKMKIFMYEVGKYKDDNAVYGIIYSDYPDSLINSEFKDEIIDEFFENAIKGTVTNIKGTIVSQNKITYNNTYPGRSAKISFMDGQGIMNMQVFLVRNRAYILEVGCETKNDNNVSSEKFFKSFALTENVKK